MNEPIEVLITQALPEPLLDQLRQVSPRLRISVHKASRAEDVPAATWARAEILYTATVLPAPEQAPKLQWVQFHHAGVDHAIHHPLLQRPGLVATTLSGANASKVAEYVVMMLLALGQHLPEIGANQLRQDWPQDRWARFTPVELRGSTVGILGYGSIGRQVARLLQPFGATILASKRNAMQPSDNDYMSSCCGDPYGDLVNRLYPAEALKGMIRECDFVVVCLPKSPENLNLVSTAELAAFKPSAYLVDVSRGGIVDHAALVASLKEQRLAGAALDVFPEEPLPADSPLWRMPNVLITPHVAGISLHYDERAVGCFNANLQRYLNNMPLYNRIDLGRGY